MRSVPASDQLQSAPSQMRWLDRLARNILLRRLAGISFGHLAFNDDRGKLVFGEANPAGELCASIQVTDPRFYAAIAFGGAIGAGEAYMQGHWVCDDLTAVVRIFVRNRAVLENLDRGTARFITPIRKLLHWINRNTKSGSRRNISAHYDLGNEFFSMWLDETMMYSSAIFEQPDMSLHAASVAKLDRICRKLELTPEDHVLEIGTGWGGFALHAASTYGCRVTTTTISSEQFAYAKDRIAEAGLDDRVTLLLEDYRNLEGRFDKLVSIEMIEAVGHKYLDTYFDCCARLLKPSGMMLLQAITIADQRYVAALKSVDFIQRYIFPGGFLPSMTAMLDSITRKTDMRSYHLEDIGFHYAKTLESWRHAFNEHRHAVLSMGYSGQFLRMWQYYFCYCEGAFLEQAIGNVQLLLVKPECRRSPIVPPLSNPSPQPLSAVACTSAGV